MRIFHLATFLQGGAGLAISQLAGAQRRGGYDVTVLASRTGVSGYGNYPAHLRRLDAAGVSVRLVDSLFTRDAALNQAALECLQALDRERSPAGAADETVLIHAHDAVPSRIGLRFAAVSSNAVVLQTMHAWGTSQSPEQSRDDVEAMNGVARVVVPNRAARELLTSLGVNRAKVSIIPYGVDRASSVPSANAVASGFSRTNGACPPCEDGRGESDADFDEVQTERERGRRVVCSMGVIGPRKNQRLLIEALSLLPAEARPLTVFVGEGAVAELTAYARERGVADAVRCVGYKVDSRRYLRSADWLVLTSRAEGMPLSVLEAFAERVPVIATDIPELRETLDDGKRGVLVTSESAPALASALERALAMPGDERQRLCDTAYRDFLARYETDAMVRAYDYEYALVCAARNAPDEPDEDQDGASEAA